MGGAAIRSRRHAQTELTRAQKLVLFTLAAMMPAQTWERTMRARGPSTFFLLPAAHAHMGWVR